MAVMTLEVPDKLVERIESFQPYFPIVLELSTTRFRTSAQLAALELLDFISRSPAPEHVLRYKLDEQTSSRLRELRYLNQENKIDEQQLLEFDEMIEIERLGRRMKIQAAKLLQENE